ncbi:MAG: VWA domain-containing protein [Bacteroidetes bacterium]|nr:VWA domain-containing protein [Bacteroidota bacterium]
MNWKTALPATILVAALFAALVYRRTAAAPGTASSALPPGKNKPDSAQSKIQVVFALDATGSMAGLIGAAKEKIWSIAGSLAQAEPAPKIEMGLIFYRDRGDKFITQKVALSKDIDQVYEKLMQMNAEGGGDTPESVNQALHEAIADFDWDTTGSTYKAVFLVGDCPPHMDYRNDVKYPVSCSDARKKDIVLNTILMGNDQEAKQIWHEIAQCNQGSYTQVNMNANDIEISTPYDSAIAVLSDQMDDTRIYYGNEKDKSEGSAKLSKSKFISGSTKANIKAQRAEYNSTKAGKETYYGEKELVEKYKSKAIDLKSIKAEELPDEMKNMTAEQQRQFIEEKSAKRDSLGKALQKLTLQRQEYIDQDLKKRGKGVADSSFSNQIYQSIKKQAEKKKIYLKKEAKY